MLSDPLRMRRLEAAIASRVTPGCVALDLGGGTGVLSMMALRAGAAKVFVVERTPVISLAKELLDANGFSGRAEFIESDWRDAAVPEPADVLIIEALGPFGIDEGILGAVARARKDGLIRPGAPVVPEKLKLHVAPVCCEDAHRAVSFWDEKPAGFDFSALKDAAVNAVYNRVFAKDEIVAPPATVAEYDFSSGPLDDFSAEPVFSFEKDSVVHGFAGWFSSDLGSGAEIDTSPFSESTHWKQNYFPLRRGFSLLRGDTIKLKMASSTGRRGRVDLHWFATHERGGEAIGMSNQSTALSGDGR